MARQSYAITTVERFRPPSSGTLSKRATVYPFAERKTISASVPVIEAALPAVSSGGGGAGGGGAATAGSGATSEFGPSERNTCSAGATSASSSSCVLRGRRRRRSACGRARRSSWRWCILCMSDVIAAISGSMQARAAVSPQQ